MVRARASVRVTSDRVAYVEFEGEYRHVPRRLLYLRWWGDIVGSVTVTASVGDPIVYRRRRSVAVGIWLPPPNIVLRITYAVKLEPALPGDGRLSELKRNSLPAVQHASAPESVDSPECAVDLEIEEKDVEALGAVYLNQEHEPSGRASRFLLYRGSPFRIFVGQLATLYSNGSVPLATLAAPGAATELGGAARELAEMARAVREHFSALLGDAFVKHRHVVVFDTPGVPSKSLGSSVLINVSGPRQPPLTERSRASFLHLLAHEYAHTWLYYGVGWRQGWMSWLLNEAMALPLALDALEHVGVRSWLDVVVEKELWGEIADSLKRPIPSIGFGTRRATSAGLVLEALRQEHREKFFAALRDLRRQGRRLPLSVEDVVEALDQHVVFGAGSTMKDALEHPRPLVAKARAIRTTPDGSWTLVLRGSRRSIERLWRRLILSDLGRSGVRSGRRVSWSGAGKDALQQLAHRLEPWHVVSQRRERELWLYRHPRIGKLWVWADTTCRWEATQTTLSMGRRLRLTVAACMALILNAEALAGYLGAARVLADLSRRLARPFVQMALARGWKADAQRRESTRG